MTAAGAVGGAELAFGIGSPVGPGEGATTVRCAGAGDAAGAAGAAAATGAGVGFGADNGAWVAPAGGGTGAAVAGVGVAFPDVWPVVTGLGAVALDDAAGTGGAFSATTGRVGFGGSMAFSGSADFWAAAGLGGNSVGAARLAACSVITWTDRARRLPSYRS